MRIGISNIIFQPTALYPPPSDWSTAWKIHWSPTISPKPLPIAASNLPRSARRHARKPSRVIRSGQNQSGFANQAARNKSNRRAAAHGGGCADNPRYV